MKKLLAIAAAVVLAVGTLTFGVTSVTGGTAAAFASNGQSQKLHQIVYSSGYWGGGVFLTTSCNETSHPTFDTVGCSILNGPDVSQEGQTFTIGWNSDFTGNLGSLTYTVSLDGLSLSGIATYP